MSWYGLSKTVCYFQHIGRGSIYLSEGDNFLDRPIENQNKYFFDLRKFRIQTLAGLDGIAGLIRPTGH